MILQDAFSLFGIGVGLGISLLVLLEFVSLGVRLVFGFFKDIK